MCSCCSCSSGNKKQQVREAEESRRQKITEAREAGWVNGEMSDSIAADLYLREEFERSRTRRHMMESDSCDLEDFADAERGGRI